MCSSESPCQRLALILMLRMETPHSSTQHPRFFLPPPLPEQISVEDRTLQHGSRIRRSSPTSLRSHGNPHIDRHDYTCPFKQELIQCWNSMYVHRKNISRGSKLTPRRVHVLPLKGRDSCAGETISNSGGWDDKRAIIPFRGREPHEAAACVF